MADTFKAPTTDESLRFLISFLFNGSLTPGLRECVRRAYLDFSRTARGVGKLPDAKTLKRTSHELLERILKEATERTPAWDGESYDTWHESQCAQIRQLYANSKFNSFSVGQAQKWLNMSVKYALTLHAVGMYDVKRADALRRVAHVPLDDFMVTALRPCGAPELGCAWSRVSSYDTYFSYQIWFRQRFTESVPLDAEFHLWLKEAEQRRKLSA